MTTKPSLNTLLQDFEKDQAQRTLPEFGPGDTVVVNVKVKEGNRERVQAYEGVVIGIKNAGLNSAFTVRKISHGFGVERVFQSHSPSIESLEVKRRGKVRAGKLYYLRGLEGKKARIRKTCPRAPRPRMPRPPPTSPQPRRLRKLPRRKPQQLQPPPSKPVRQARTTATSRWPFAFAAMTRRPLPGHRIVAGFLR